jgi:putative nucleotidyltransferase with HDIG domain
VTPEDRSADDEDDLLVRGVVGAYRLVASLGRGAMGRVYEARHELLGRRVAMKVLLPEAASSEEAVARFIDEARAVNDIRHPGIVDVTDFGEVDGRPYYIMELLEGETLARRLAHRGRLELTEAVDVTLQVATALAAVHDRGVVHRDLKPENIFLCRGAAPPDRVKILDFGVAKLLAPGPVDRRLTRTGTVVGTPLYMSPEQCLGSAALDHRSDVYTLGLVLYEMLTGAPPFDRDNMAALLVAHVYERPPPPRRLEPAIPAAVEKIILRTLAKDPADRLGDMRALHAALAGAAGAVPAPVRPPSPPSPPPRPAPAPAPVAAPEPAPEPEVDLEPDDPGAAASPHEKVATTLQGILLRRIRQDRLVIPALPATAIAALAELNRPETNPYRVGRALGKDPLFVSQILRVASSAAFGSETVHSVEQAIVRIGMSRTRTIVYELSARMIFHSPRPRVREHLHAVWEHAMTVAAVARRIVVELGRGLDPEEAYLAGLLQDVGKPVVAAYLLEAERMLARKGVIISEEALPEVVERAHRPVGVALAARWGLPASVQRVIGRSDRYRDDADALLGNVVVLADAIAEAEDGAGAAADAAEERIADGAERLGLDWRFIHQLRQRAKKDVRAS